MYLFWCAGSGVRPPFQVSLVLVFFFLLPRSPMCPASSTRDSVPSTVACLASLARLVPQRSWLQRASFCLPAQSACVTSGYLLGTALYTLPRGTHPPRTKQATITLARAHRLTLRGRTTPVRTLDSAPHPNATHSDPRAPSPAFLRFVVSSPVSISPSLSLSSSPITLIHLPLLLLFASPRLSPHALSSRPRYFDRFAFLVSRFFLRSSPRSDTAPTVVAFSSPRHPCPHARFGL